ncbi:glutamic acid-rich protein-like [Fagus crenata]
MNVVNVVDVSSFMLFEATGDSEADSNTILGDIGQNISMADDDAESCSYDLSDDSYRASELDCDIQSYVHVDYDDDEDDDEDDDDDDEEHEEDDEEEVHSYQRWTSKQDWKLMGHQKSSVSVDTSKELMNEAERSRLFWEACLAS